MGLEIHTSTVADGSMKSLDQHFQSVLAHRGAFLARYALRPENATLVQVVYETDNFCRYVTLNNTNKGDGISREATIVADALTVTKPGHALFLPLADCIGAVIHDPIKNLLMMSHLGRQNLEQNGGTGCIDYLVREHDVDPAKLTVWLSPSAGIETYPLYAFDNRSLQDVAIEQLSMAGIENENITVSPIDSATHEDYFSHSQYLKNNRESDGRFAVVAVLTA